MCFVSLSFESGGDKKISCPFVFLQDFDEILLFLCHYLHGTIQSEAEILHSCFTAKLKLFSLMFYVKIQLYCHLEWVHWAVPIKTSEDALDLEPGGYRKLCITPEWSTSHLSWKQALCYWTSSSSHLLHYPLAELGVDYNFYILRLNRIEKFFSVIMHLLTVNTINAFVGT